MPNCNSITNNEMNVRLDSQFGLSHFNKRTELEFLNAFLNERVQRVNIGGNMTKCAKINASWKEICLPTGDVECDDSCDFTAVNNQNCIDALYEPAKCHTMPDYSFNTSEYECRIDPNSGLALSTSLEEDIARTELVTEQAIIENKVIPYFIGVVDGAVGTVLAENAPNNVTINAGVVEVKPSQMGESLEYIIDDLIMYNNITRPLLIVGNKNLKSANMMSIKKGEGSLFGNIPAYYDHKNIFKANSEEAIYLVNLDAFAMHTWTESEPNVMASDNLMSPTYGESIVRWHEGSRITPAFTVEKFQKKTCVNDSHESIARRMKIHADLLVAPDSVCNAMPKVIKILCA